MNMSDTIIGLIIGFVINLIPRFTRTKKENDELLLGLIKSLQSEVERMHVDLAKVRKEYDLKLQNVQTEYSQLLIKYNQLKKDFQEYKTKNK